MTSEHAHLLAEGFGELIGPILIFGIYIVASLAKAVAKKGRSEDSGEETESELKKAVRRRYQEIYQKQVGQTPSQGSPKQPRQQPNYQPKPVSRTEPAIKRQRSEWEIRQEALRQRNAKIQPQRPNLERPKPNIIKQVSVAETHKKPRHLKPVEKIFDEIPKKHYQQTSKVAVKESRIQTSGLNSLLKDPQNLRSAIILKEILDKPLALREI